MSAVREIVVDGVTFVPKRTEDYRGSDPAYVELATKLLSHPDVIRAMAIRLAEEGM